MKDVMIYLTKTIDQKHTLADIASYCHLSNSECCRLFQRNVHLSPVDYLNQLRIHMSLSEIIKHEKKITDIAKMYGFSGSSYFSEMFKKTLGITPRAFYKSVLQQQTLSSNADPIHGRRWISSSKEGSMLVLMPRSSLSLLAWSDRSLISPHTELPVVT